MPASVLVGADEIPPAQLSAVDRADQLTYESVTNYARAIKGATQLCVMCGHGARHDNGVVIPRQNKDVCRDCDKAIWLHNATGAYFKWCKGCKNFLQIGNFSQKYVLFSFSFVGDPRISRSLLCVSSFHSFFIEKKKFFLKKKKKTNGKIGISNIIFPIQTRCGEM